jgi:hypothetical protein
MSIARPPCSVWMEHERRGPRNIYKISRKENNCKGGKRSTEKKYH